MAQRRRFTSEFKFGAVRLVHERDLSPGRVARDLGVGVREPHGGAVGGLLNSIFFLGGHRFVPHMPSQSA